MAVLVEIDLPAEVSVELYDAVALKISEHAEANGRPDGLIVHVGVLGDPIRVVDVWESAEQYASFAENVLGPAVDEASGGNAPEPSPPRITPVHEIVS